jgi:hypothetical protein
MKKLKRTPLSLPSPPCKACPPLAEGEGRERGTKISKELNESNVFVF